MFPGRKQQDWSWTPHGCQAGSKLLPCAVLSILSPAIMQPGGEWLVVYPGPNCRTNIKDFLNSSHLVFVGLTKEALTKWFCFCFRIVLEWGGKYLSWKLWKFLKKTHDQTQNVLTGKQCCSISWELHVMSCLCLCTSFTDQTSALARHQGEQPPLLFSKEGYCRAS